MYSTQIFLAEDILTDIDVVRKSIKTQTTLIMQMLEKVNTVLLQIEGTKISKAAAETKNCALYIYNEKAVISLKKMIENTSKFLNIFDYPVIDIQKNFHSCEQYVEFISMNIRKLLVFVDTLHQIHATKLDQDNEDEEGFEI
ncbi:uncharacterized protein LOC119631616 [Glossina fuscipes]|uniref:Uncharacterized protein LOC119631616 n=1 Tax=Glossina fuscipes TaxID=7396 RepID=A0A8U0W426_9MUSC|nr:uncharacterized protein LOC119631616 [Glossina fuscipes]